MRSKKPETVRPTSLDERKGIKTVTQRGLRQVGASNFAPDTRVVESKLSEYGSTAKMDAFMPVDVVADLERVIGYPLISEHLAQMQGYRLVVDEAAVDSPDMEDVSALSDAQGRLLSMLIRAGIDGHYDNFERREILPVAEALQAQLATLIRGLKGVVS